MRTNRGSERELKSKKLPYPWTGGNWWEVSSSDSAPEEQPEDRCCCTFSVIPLFPGGTLKLAIAGPSSYPNNPPLLLLLSPYRPTYIKKNTLLTSPLPSSSSTSSNSQIPSPSPSPPKPRRSWNKPHLFRTANNCVHISLMQTSSSTTTKTTTSTSIHFPSPRPELLLHLLLTRPNHVMFLPFTNPFPFSLLFPFFINQNLNPRNNSQLWKKKP